MLQLATPPDRPRPALLASIGLHALAVSAFGFGPLLAFPDVPGWSGAVFVVTQPDLSVFRETTTVDLRGPRPASSGGGGGGLPSAPREGPPARRAEPSFQPEALPSGLPAASDEEPWGEPGFDGGVDLGPGDGSVPRGGPGGGTGDEPIDLRGAAAPDLVLPVPLETPAPRYSDTARIARASGVVVLSATIAADGRVVDVVVESSANPLLDRSAVEAVSGWRYRPARVGERNVAVILRVTLTFRLV